MTKTGGRWLAVLLLAATLGIANCGARAASFPSRPVRIVVPFAPGGSIADHVQVQGKDLSYNNLNDADAALELVAEFRDGPPTVVIVKSDGNWTVPAG